MATLIIGVDLADTQFELAIANVQFEIQQRKRLSRQRFTLFCHELPPSLFLMEACSSAHHWARTLQAEGHQVRLLPPRYVQTYVRRSKTDAADAAALIEAIRCCELRPVPVKSIDQQAVLQLHRLREQYKITRNARLCLLRSALREFGCLTPKGLKCGIASLRTPMQETSAEFPTQLIALYRQVLDEVDQLQQNIVAVETTLRALDDNCFSTSTTIKTSARELTGKDRVVQDLMKICGVGPLTATALRATVGEIERFPSGRHLACWLGLTAREYSTGERHRLGRISRTGDRYVRTLLINGARSALMAANRFYTPGGRPLDQLRLWALGIQHRRGINKATVALASKLARIIWATWRYQRSFDGNWSGSAARGDSPLDREHSPNISS
jgi:transposase